MCHIVWRSSGFPKNRVIGMAGVLDTSRFRAFIAEELNVAVEDIQAMVLGGHGDAMLPFARYATVSGVPIEQFLEPEAISRLIERTRQGGTEIVNLLKTGSAFYAAAASTTQMVESIVFDSHRFLPASVRLDGEFGLSGVFMGVPIILGRRGVERIVEIKLTDSERTALEQSAEEVRAGIQAWEDSTRR
jgi:malate dehydrogenase